MGFHTGVTRIVPGHLCPCETICILCFPFDKGIVMKLENHASQIAVFMVVYNFHRKHMTLKTTPAVKAGIADRIWSIEEIVGLLEKREMEIAA
jgi:hypothetical protein